MKFYLVDGVTVTDVFNGGMSVEVENIQFAR